MSGVGLGLNSCTHQGIFTPPQGGLWRRGKGFPGLGCIGTLIRSIVFTPYNSSCRILREVCLCGKDMWQAYDVLPGCNVDNNVTL